MEDYEPAAHYDRVTDAWGLLLGEDLHYGYFASGQESLPAATAALTDLMVQAAQLRPGHRVLDVGCGSGGPACRIVQDHGVNVVGITTSEVGVAAARERAREGRFTNAEFLTADGTDNGLPDESFDRVWVLESSHLMPDRSALIAECARVLRPGGRMALCDIVRRREIPFLELRDRRRDFATLRAAFGAARMDPLAAYADLATAEGLEVEEARDISDETRPTFARWQDNLDRHRGRLTETLGTVSVADFEASLRILDGLWEDGTLGYALLAASKPA